MSPSAERGGDEVLARLDYIAQILQVALAPQLDAGREHLRSDPLTAAIFDQTAGDWMPSGALQRSLAEATGKVERTVRTRLGELAERGLISQRGEGHSRSYRSAGLV
jgi:hypothetical protein